MPRSRRSTTRPSQVAAPPRPVSSSSLPATRIPPRPATSNLPARPTPTPAAPASSSGGMMSGLASTVAQGFAFGTGSAVAHRAVGSVLGGSGSSHPEQTQQAQPMADPCQRDIESFYKCLDENQGQIASCQFFFDSMQSCRLNNPQ